ncbi:MAG: GNAT family N-acetyltransferase [Crocinitomicaceae bacterium]|nr:GNAT family N-acetyltransferase [Crocinitomicaceae bacterium]
MQNKQVVYREIRREDNEAMAQVIRHTLEEFGANKPGTVYTDPTTDDLFSLFQTEKSVYYVATFNGEIIGGCGIYPTPELPPNYGELVKLYLSHAFRGKGIGKKLMEIAVVAAINFGYEKLYLETMPELDMAIQLYESLGFESLPNRLGASGHSACHIWMLKDLDRG